MTQCEIIYHIVLWCGICVYIVAKSRLVAFLYGMVNVLTDTDDKTDMQEHEFINYIYVHIIYINFKVSCN